MQRGLQPWGPGGHRAWLRWRERWLPGPTQRVLRPQVQPELQKRRRVQPGLLAPRPRGLQQQVPGLWELRDPERVLRDVIQPTGQAPWARLPELRT